jgi:anti-sigma regulatory factor (Ser/Thr protein kinase)
MDHSSFRAEITDGLAGLVRFRFDKNHEDRAGLQLAVPAFERLLAEGRRNFIFDLQNIPYPPTSFIAFLVAATLRARNARGDVKLVNVADSARNNLVTFSPLTYLSLEEKESEAEQHLLMDTDGKDEEAGAFYEANDHERAGEPLFEPTEISRFGNIGIREEAGDVQSHHLRVESIASNLYRLCDFVTDHARLAGMEEKDVGKIKIAVYEACLNVIEHAYHSNPNYWIELTVNYTPDQFAIVIQDRGIPFEMPKFEVYDVEEAMQKRRTGGFGLHIIRRATDEVDYKSDPVNGNRLTMIKKLR